MPILLLLVVLMLTVPLGQAPAEPAPKAPPPSSEGGSEAAPGLSIIDRAVNRHLLTEFGPCKNWVEASAALEKGCKALVAQGGGVIVIPKGIDRNFLPRNALQDVATKTGVLVEDYRDGVLRLNVLPEGVASSSGSSGGGVILERDLVNDVQGQGGGNTLCIANRYRGGLNSINDIISRDTKKGRDAKLYVQSLRGICPGNYFYLQSAEGRSEGRIKDVGMDGNEPYFVADLQHDARKGDRYFNKNWLGALHIEDIHNCDDQSGSLDVTRKTYGTGDSFGITVDLDFAGDIMSAGGDEGAVLYTAEIRNDINLFWGFVEKWDSKMGKLVYKAEKAENFHKIGTSRPILNMNPKKWITSGKVIVPQNGFNYKGIVSSVVGNPDVKWDASIIGKWIAINEPDESFQPGEDIRSAPVGAHPVHRWFHIVSLEKRKDGLWNLGVETVWWGSHRGGAPRLFQQSNYNTSDEKPRELGYIITSGSWALDVRNAIGRGFYIGNTPAERTIKLAPFQQAEKAFEPGDPITQPPGPTPWLPTGFRVRHFTCLPGLMPGGSYESNNFGKTSVGAALVVGGPAGSLEEIEKGQKDGLPSYGAGVSLLAASSYGLYIKGPTKYGALWLDQQQHGDVKPIVWLCKNGIARIHARPTNGDLVMETSGQVDMMLKGSLQQMGISGTTTAAKNLRGINVTVAAGAKELTVRFSQPEADNLYSLNVQPSWLTQDAVIEKTVNGFKVAFGTPPEAPGRIDWQLIR